MTSSTVFNRVRSTGIVRLVVSGLFFLAAGVGSALAAGCGASFPAGRHDLSLDINGQTRSAVYFIPSNYSGKRKVPVVFDFHGSNSNPDGQMNRSQWDEVAEREGFIVMALQGSLSGEFKGTNAWNVPGVTKAEGLDEGAFIRTAVHYATETFCVDPARIYASGYSGGGRMLSQYVCDGYGDFAAAGFVMGLRAGYPEQEDGVWRPRKASCHPAKPVSIIAFSGLKDDVNPFGGGGKAYWQYGGEVALKRWAELDGCDPHPRSEKGETATFSAYYGCKAGTSVISYVIKDADHSWPGDRVRFRLAGAQGEKIREVDATGRMWDFFRNSGGELLAGVPQKTACPADKTTAGKEAGVQGKTCSQQVKSDNSEPVVTDGL
ncbi:polyhydroxybutyrate depolymerase [Rhizobium sp. ACO-34A]|nr:PHB depolymerase family esterase [Rhizobium sp. ACO-34A]ATN35281.1 polyhydroxybutyrate depolymerase [Rhizobium sp. ACO-34A]